MVSKLRCWFAEKMTVNRRDLVGEKHVISNSFDDHLGAYRAVNYYH
jgi:hypothetical protein